MKRKNRPRSLKLRIKQLVLLSLIAVAFILLSPNLILILNYKHIPENTSPLYHTYLVWFQDTDDLCVASQLEGSMAIIPILRFKLVLDGEVIPFNQIYWQRRMLSDLTSEFEANVICVKPKVEIGQHELIVILYNDLFHVRSTQIAFEALPKGYRTV